MAIFKTKLEQQLAEFDEEQRLYEVASNEFSDGQSNPELRAKVIAEAHGNEDFAKVSYIEMRVEMLRKEKSELPEQATDVDAIANVDDGVAEEPLPAIAEPQKQEKSPGTGLTAKTLGGYASTLLGVVLISVALLYLSVGGTQTGVSIFLVGVVILILGLIVLKPFRKLT
jgi:hypothetical protein